MDMGGGLGPATCGCVQRNVAGDSNALGINSARGKVRVGLGHGIRLQPVQASELHANRVPSSLTHARNEKSQSSRRTGSPPAKRVPITRTAQLLTVFAALRSMA